MQENNSPNTDYQPQYPEEHLPYVAPAQGNMTVSSVAPPEQPSSKPHRSKKKYMVFGIVLLLFVLSTSFVGASLGIAYDYIKLPNKDVEKNIKGVVLSIPFLPKTPEYVLARALEAHKDIKTTNFDASLAITSDSLLSSLGLKSMDVKVAGDVDYKNPDNIQFQLEGDIGNLFAGSARKKDTRIYAKVDQIPTALLAMSGIDTSKIKPLLGQWFYYDYQPLQTAARDLVSGQDKQPVTNEIVTKLAEALSDEQILKSLKLTNQDYNGQQVYQIDFSASKEDIDYIDQKLQEVTGEKYQGDSFKLSNVISKLDISLKISKDDYLVRWASTQVEIQNTKDTSSSVYVLSPYIGDSGKVSAAFVLKMDNYNQDVVIDEPQGAITADEMISKLSSALQFDSNSAAVRDQGRYSAITQLGHATEAYATSHGGNYMQSNTSWGQAIVDAGELNSIPKEITYESGEACQNNQVNNYCYESTSDEGIVFAKLESDSNKAICDGSTSACTGDAYVLYSTKAGRGGVICSQLTSLPANLDYQFCKSGLSSSGSSYSNPGMSFAKTRDTQRQSDLLEITNAIYRFAAEHNGNLPDTDNDDTRSNFPQTPTCIGTSPKCFDLGASGGESTTLNGAYSDPIVPKYIQSLPEDPSTGTSSNSGYTIMVNAKGRVVATAKGESTPTITVER